MRGESKRGEGRARRSEGREARGVRRVVAKKKRVSEGWGEAGGVGGASKGRKETAVIKVRTEGRCCEGTEGKWSGQAEAMQQRGGEEREKRRSKKEYCCAHPMRRNSSRRHAVRRR